MEDATPPVERPSMSIGFDAVPGALFYDFYVGGHLEYELELPPRWWTRLLGRRRTVLVPACGPTMIYRVDCTTGIVTDFQAVMVRAATMTTHH